MSMSVPSQPRLAEALGVDSNALRGDRAPRRPCSDAEREAANRLTAWLDDRGVEARLEEFLGYPSFGAPYAALFTASLAGGILFSAPVAGVSGGPGTRSLFRPWCPPRWRRICA